MTAPVAASFKSFGSAAIVAAVAGAASLGSTSLPKNSEWMIKNAVLSIHTASATADFVVSDNKANVFLRFAHNAQNSAFLDPFSGSVGFKIAEDSDDRTISLTVENANPVTASTSGIVQIQRMIDDPANIPTSLIPA